LDTDHQNEHEQSKPSDEQTLQVLQEMLAASDVVAPGVPIVRANTPRPISFAHPTSKSAQTAPAAIFPAAADFPVEAPAAPPLPEELEDGEGSTPTAAESIPSPVTAVQPVVKQSEYTWLFEYGLEMDAEYLNSPTRLNGQARIYGPAVLKGYRIEGIELRNGQTTVTLARGLSPEHEVWGILYRIPRHLAEQNDHELSALDRVHAAYSCTATPVAALEIYRKRLVPCITYMLSEAVRQDQALYSPATSLDQPFSQQLLEIGRRQKLPETYLAELSVLTRQHREPTITGPLQTDQNTEPLPVITASPEQKHVPVNMLYPSPTIPSKGWLLALAIYVVGLLMATLALAVMQALGYWPQVFNASFTPLGVPWYMLLYGLLGGCMSCIITLGRRTSSTPPGFVILTWFTRPFVGAILAALAYLVLTSGMFVISIAPEQRYALFSLVGAIAGLSEGWLLFRQKITR